MRRAIAEEETITGVPGVRFTTDAQPDTEHEGRLQDIQRDLADGVVLLPSPTTLPHLSVSLVKSPDGSEYSVISLWVPSAKRSEAAELLREAGFTVP